MFFSAFFVIFTYLYFYIIVIKLSFSHASGKIFGAPQAPLHGPPMVV